MIMRWLMATTVICLVVTGLALTLRVSMQQLFLTLAPSGIRARDGSICQASSSFLIKDFVERGGKLVTKAGKCTVRSKRAR